MKQGIHPEGYRPVVFRDASNGHAFLTRSTIQTERTIQWEDGNEYPLVNLEISAASHPFYTGTQRLLDTAGRVERFNQRYGGAKKGTDKKAAPVEAEAAAEEAPNAETSPEEAATAKAAPKAKAKKAKAKKAAAKPAEAEDATSEE